MPREAAKEVTIPQMLQNTIYGPFGCRLYILKLDWPSAER
jgi:hypothetical protein